MMMCQDILNKELLKATYEGNISLVKKVLSYGADIEVRNDVDLTALMLAVRWNHPKVVITLLEAGADVNSCTDHGMTPLMWASRYGLTNISFILLNSGADLNAVDSDGTTALMFAVSPYGSPLSNIISVLINAGIDVDIKNNEEKTAFTIGNESCRAIIEEALLKCSKKSKKHKYNNIIRDSFIL